ncbi:hypothetical protein AGLY_011342 [Aphis glycines]|uniref:Uncharacterized protein n=1 Tax=Aphis glycines TaxID=307491 RepID=A0A6G0TD52_APHGL|nr:hypothetical protein AGLY_011342 [Aphis glycines]
MERTKAVSLQIRRLLSLVAGVFSSIILSILMCKNQTSEKLDARNGVALRDIPLQNAGLLCSTRLNFKNLYIKFPANIMCRDFQFNLRKIVKKKYKQLPRIHINEMIMRRVSSLNMELKYSILYRVTCGQSPHALTESFPTTKKIGNAERKFDMLSPFSKRCIRSFDNYPLELRPFFFVHQTTNLFLKTYIFLNVDYQGLQISNIGHLLVKVGETRNKQLLFFNYCFTSRLAVSAQSTVDIVSRLKLVSVKYNSHRSSVITKQ